MAEGAMQLKRVAGKWLKEWSDRRRLLFLWKNLSKWVNFDPLEYAMNGIGVFAGKLLCLFQRRGFDDDQAPCLIRERTGQDDSTLRIKGFHFSEMCRTIDLSLSFSVGTIESENDKFHNSSKVERGDSDLRRDPLPGNDLYSRWLFHATSELLVLRASNIDRLLDHHEDEESHRDRDPDP